MWVDVVHMVWPLSEQTIDPHLAGKMMRWECYRAAGSEQPAQLVQGMVEGVVLHA